MSDQKTAADLREHLFAALQGLRDGSMKVETAKAMSDVAQTVINSAKVEVEYLRLCGGESKFLDVKSAETPQPTSTLPQGITGIRQHRLAG